MNDDRIHHSSFIIALGYRNTAPLTLRDLRAIADHLRTPLYPKMLNVDEGQTGRRTLESAVETVAPNPAQLRTTRPVRQDPPVTNDPHRQVAARSNPALSRHF